MGDHKTMYTKQTVFPAIILAILALLTIIIAPAAATTQLVALQGRVLQSGSPATSGSIAVTIWSASGDPATVLYSDNFANAISDGFFDVMLGSSSELNLTYGNLYYLDVSVNGQDINWTSPTETTVNRIQFQSRNGQIPAGQIASQAVNASHLNSSGTYYMGTLGLNNTLPNATLDVAGGIRLTGGNFTCGVRNRGELIYEPGATNADDKLWWCAKNSTDIYNRVLISRGG